MTRSILLILTIGLGLPFFGVAQAPVAAFSADPVEGCSPLVVSFTDQSAGNPSAWYWEFGNGATSTLKNPSTTYFIPGTYTVKLTVTNAGGTNTLTKTGFVTVYGNPEVRFSVPDSIGCYPFPVQFSDNTIASPGTTNTAWVWDLGDGTQSTRHNPATVYPQNGNYTVSLKVTNNKGCWSLATKHGYIRINGGVKAGFTFLPAATCQPPFLVAFQNTSTGPGQLSYTWQFGDSATSTEASPKHSYSKNGLYAVTLITKSSEGCVDTARRPGLINLQAISTGFAAPDSACAGDPVLFTNTSSAAAATTIWDFGDGSFSASTNPVKTFATEGTYQVRLRQAYPLCADSALKTIRVFARPVAAFTADTTTGCQPPLTVRFKNNSTGALSYQWSFGDGTTSTEENPAHTYTAYGNFAVKLVVTNASGCTDTYFLPTPVNVNKPQVTFTSLPVSGCVPFAVLFEADVKAPDPVKAYLWDFGNGVTSAEVRPSFTYTEPGTFAVKLTVTTASGCTETYTLDKAVTLGRKPKISFSAVPNPVCAFKPVQFTNTTGDGGSYFWSFGDGGTSTQANPIYQYSDTGTFDIRLIADNNGCRDTLLLKDYITVNAPIARFTQEATCANKLFYTFRNRSVGAKTWVWDFGDGTTSTEQHPTHTFADYGVYTVTLTVTNDSCEHTMKARVRIVNGTPDFAIAPAVACKGTPITFTADSTNWANIVSYTWNFGFGGTPGDGRTASAVYPRSGTYNVSLTVRDINGCVDSIVKKQAIRMNGPIAGLKAQNNNGCKGIVATFTNTSKDDGRVRIALWEWDLGDGTVIKQTVPLPIQHRYENAGSYDVGLMVTDTAGCADSLLLPALVRTSDIKADFASADTVSCPGATIRFTNASKASAAYTSLWRFGDGKTSRQQNASTTYSATGLYAVQLTIADVNGCTDSIQRKDYISIKRPVAAFTVNDTTSSCVPFQVQYTNTSSYYTDHVWDLSGGTSRLLHPTQYYNEAGVYRTKLTVTSPGGCTDTAIRTISVYNIAASKIDYLPLSGCKPLTVDLAATTPVKMDFIWDFGDGTIISSKDTVRQHVYNYFGDFVPKIIMKNSDGCVVAITGLDTIRIKGATVKYGLNNRQFCDSGTVFFSDSTTFNNPIIRYHWNFGDGTTSAQPSPSHFYSKPGLYNVSLSVQTQNLCVDTFKLAYPVNVAASPAIGIAGDSVICAGEGIVHRGLFERHDTAAVRWSWTFPNGNSAAVQLPAKQLYGRAGRFRVQTVAVNSNGCGDTAWQHIVVNPIPSVTLPSTITTTAGTPVLLPAIYTHDIRRYHWSPPDGLSCSDCPQPLATPKRDVNYSVQFTDNNGCRNEGRVQVIVLCNNDNVFVPNTFSPNGDGSNDFFYVRGRGLNRVKMMRVYNRWGQVVFEKANFSVNDAAAGWDGSYKGAKAVPDVYVYQVEIFCDNNEVVKLEGNVALIQ